MILLQWLATLRNTVLDAVFLTLSEFASETLAILVICVIFWCIQKKAGLTVAFGWFISAILVQGMKIVFRIDRPWILDPNFLPVEDAVAGAGGYSFPSGHTQSAFAIYGSLALMIKNKGWRAALFLLPVLIGFSRMYLGVHTLLDVGVSMVLTLAVVVCIKVIWADPPFSAKRLNRLSLAVLVLCFILMVLALGLYAAQVITVKYMSDACQVVGSGFGFALGILLGEGKHAEESVKPRSILGGILRIVLGLAGVIAIQTVTRLPAIKSIAATLIGYTLLTFWVVLLYPMIVRKVTPANKNAA